MPYEGEGALQETIPYSDFEKLVIRAGTIVAALPNPKARNPAYILDIDFGHVGLKKSSAQVTEAYSAEELIGKQIIAVMNFSPKRIAGIVSEVLVLAIVQNEGPTVLLTPSMPVMDGARMA